MQFSSKSYFNNHSFTLYRMQLSKFVYNFLQATNIVIEDWHGLLVIPSLCCPLNYRANREETIEFCNFIRNRFIARSNFNAKQFFTLWIVRLTAPSRSILLYQIMQQLQIGFLSTVIQTYWPTDVGRIT